MFNRPSGRLLLAHPYEIHNALFVVFLMAAYIMRALFAGPDVDWDLRNYHFYVGYAFLHGGFEKNLFPAQMQGWFNPLLDAVTVFLMQNLRPVFVAVILAFLQSLNLPLLAIIIRQSSIDLLKKQSPLSCGIIRGAALTIGALGAMTISELGASFGDALVTIPLLASLVLLGRAFAAGVRSRKQTWFLWIASAGFCFGIGVGLKLTIAFCAPGFLLCFFCFKLRPAQIAQYLACFGVAALAGLLISDGFWLWQMWQSTGNPFFPALNGLFHSSWIDTTTNLLDARFRRQSFADGLKFPIASAFGQSPGAETSYYDLRFVLTCALAPVAIYQIWRRRSTGWSLALVLFFYVSFVVWLIVFGVMRYAVPLEYLSGIVLLLVVGQSTGKNYRDLVLGALAVFLSLTVQIPQWGTHLDWDSDEQQKNWFGVTIPEELAAPDAMFLMLTDQPMSYVIPFFRPDSVFVRLEGNFDPAPGTYLYDKRRQAIAAHAGPFLTLSPMTPSSDELTMLATYGLVRVSIPCMQVETNTGLLFACPLERQ